MDLYKMMNNTFVGRTIGIERETVSLYLLSHA